MPWMEFIIDSRLTDINAFPSLNSSPETASSVPSAPEEPPTERIITVWTDFRHHGIWLKKNFPEEITTRIVYFVHQILRIANSADVAKYTSFTPKDRARMLGNEDLDKYMINLTNLMINWKYTAG